MPGPRPWRPWRPLLVAAVLALAAAALPATAAAAAQANATGGAATLTAAPLDARNEQDLLKWSLCANGLRQGRRQAARVDSWQRSWGARLRPAASALADRHRQPLPPPTSMPCRAPPPTRCAAHSDPEELRAAAAAARAAADAGSADFQEQQARVAALLDELKGQPTEAELMQARWAGVRRLG